MAQTIDLKGLVSFRYSLTLVNTVLRTKLVCAPTYLLNRWLMDTVLVASEGAKTPLPI